MLLRAGRLPYPVLATVVRVLIATLLAMLPRRYWTRFEPVLPVWRMVPAAAALTMLAGFAIGIPGFFAHLEETVAQNNALYLEAAARARTEEFPTPSALSGLGLFTFILLTPQGWAWSYLVLTGFVRLAGAHFDDPHGDFVLTLADAGVRRVGAATARRAAIDNRHLLEGPEVRDRIVHGAQLGLPDAAVVVVASRLKEGWEVGAVLLTDRGAFRILAVEDRTIGGRLRCLYSLTPHEDLEVFRRAVQYRFPAGEVAIVP
jgi:hypothetical protein